MNKLKGTVIALSLLVSTGLVGCTNISKYNEFEASEIIGTFEKMVFEKNNDKYDIYKYANENIPKMPDVEMSSTMVNSLIYLVYQNIEYYYNMSVLLQDELLLLESKLDVELLDNTIIDKIPKELKVVKAYMEELEDNYLKLVKNNSVYVVEVDIEKISKDFNEYMNNDTKKYLDFRLKESTSEVYNINSDEYNIKVMAELINDIYSNLEQLEGVTQLENWVEHLEYYFDLIFSVTQDKFLDNEGKIVQEALDELKKQSDLYKDTKFGEILKEYTDIVEKNNLDINTEEVTNYLEVVYNELNSFLVEE